MLEGASVDIIEISGGSYEQPKQIGADYLSINPERSEVRKESTIAREAYFLEYASNIRKAVSLPLMVQEALDQKKELKVLCKVIFVRLLGWDVHFVLIPIASRK